MKRFAAFVTSSAIVATFLAHTTFAVSPTQTPAMTPAPVMEQKSQYLLPYPGILPDHPLYFLKALRDRILEILIVDPLRKSEFYLLQADKRLNMAIFTENKGVTAQRIESVAMAEQFMERTVSGLVAFRNSGSQVPASTVDRLEKSLAKHAEVLENFLTNAAAEAERTVLESALAKVRSLQGEIEKLK